jgi:hypothetical protein
MLGTGVQIQPNMRELLKRHITTVLPSAALDI